MKKILLTHPVLVCLFVIGETVAGRWASAATVAGCDGIGTFCDITPKISAKNTVYAPRVEVWSRDEALAKTAELVEFINKTNQKLTAKQESLKEKVITSLNQVQADLDLQEGQARASLDKLENKLRANLKKELRKLLQARTCSDIQVDPKGSAARAAQLHQQFVCIETSLSSWLGIDIAGSSVAPLDSNQITGDQLGYMLDKLTEISSDTELSRDERRRASSLLERVAELNTI